LVESGYDRQIFYGCFLHVLNLACQAAITVYDDSRSKKELRIRLAEDSDFSGSEDSNDEEDPDYDEADEYVDELQDVQTHSNAVLNARQLAVFINRNDNRNYNRREMFAKSQDVCKLPTNFLLQDMKVRWNSTHDMIARLIANEKALKLLSTLNPEVFWPLLSDQDWVQLKELNEFLLLFKDFFKFFQDN
jgi:hypothetical protein